MQSRLSSFIESVANLIIGYIVAIVSQVILFPWFDIHISMHDNMIIGLWFMGISFVRSYVLRRFFNSIINKG